MGVVSQILNSLRRVFPVRKLQSMDGHQKMRRGLSVFVLRREVARSRPLNVVLGSGETRFAGWLSTDQHLLDVRVSKDWAALFRESSIDRLLAEHLFEHLSEDDCLDSFRLCYRYLKPGGRLRVAVPDGLRPDPEYIKGVAPPADGHLCLFRVNTLVPLLESAGFRTEPLEYFDQQGRFQRTTWSAADGPIHRAAPPDCSALDGNGALGYTSLIIDAVKE